MYIYFNVKTPNDMGRVQKKKKTIFFLGTNSGYV